MKNKNLTSLEKPNKTDNKLEIGSVSIKKISIVKKYINIKCGGPHDPPIKTEIKMMKINNGKLIDGTKLKPDYFYIFDKPIFYGSGEFSNWKSKQLKKQIKKLENIYSGSQQDGTEDFETDFEIALKKNIKKALKL